jgi:hypothetical protein
MGILLKRGRKGALIGFGIVLAIAIIACGAVWLVSSTAPTPPEVATCKRSTCGPLELADCGSAFDAPLFVYVRVSGHYLGDCGHWSASLYNTGFCRVVGKFRNYCAP